MKNIGMDFQENNAIIPMARSESSLDKPIKSAPTNCWRFLIFIFILLLTASVIAACLLIFHQKCVLDLSSDSDNQWQAYEDIKEYHNESFHRQMVEEINAMPEATWKAVYNKAAGKQVEKVANDDEEDQDAMTKIVQKKSFDSVPDSYISQVMSDETPIPTSFDVREKWTKCWTTHEIFDQGACGACWAVSSATSLSDRICIHSNYTKQPQISVEDLISCGHEGNGCLGGHPGSAFIRFVNEGIVSGGVFGSQSGCKPFSIPNLCGHPCPLEVMGEAAVCDEQCQPYYHKSYEQDLHKGKWFFADEIFKPLAERTDLDGMKTNIRDQLLPTIYQCDDPSQRKFEYFRQPEYINMTPYCQLSCKNTAFQLKRDFFIFWERLETFCRRKRTSMLHSFMQRELMRNGPFVVCFTMYDDIQHYSSGVYKHLKGDELIGHAVKVMGWGEEMGEKYWLVANSFGRAYGENGFMKITMETEWEYFAMAMPL